KGKQRPPAAERGQSVVKTIPPTSYTAETNRGEAATPSGVDASSDGAAKWARLSRSLPPLTSAAAYSTHVRDEKGSKRCVRQFPAPFSLATNSSCCSSTGTTL